MPWEKQYDESHVLDQAMQAFWAQGYEATSISDLVAATGINRGSIYAAYTDKRTLFIEALRRYDKVHRDDFLDRIARTHAPLDAIIQTFEEAGRSAGPDGAPGGCLLVNSVLEVSPHDPEIRAFLDACLGKVEDFFCSMIEAAQGEGSIGRSLKARETAQALLGLFLGLRVLTRSAPHPSAIKAITSQAKTMLAA